LPASQADGILSKMIYNNSNQAGVAGVEVVLKLQEQLLQTLTIKAEYDQIYAAIPAVVLNGSEQPLIYAPRSHKQLIVAANNVTTDFKTI
jgi:hypothetical protein